MNKPAIPTTAPAPLFVLAILLVCLVPGLAATARADAPSRIRPWPGNPSYWLYFTTGGSVTLDLTGTKAVTPLQLQWISLATGKPLGKPTPVTSGQVVPIKTPDHNGSVAAITPRPPHTP